ncbi:preprotein translocase subunit SecG [bacterium]|nr:preprotein translocase subunit SecG [bacterium]
MVYVVVIFHLLVAIALVVSILLQSGRGGGLAGALGGTMSAGSVFGGRGASDLLAKITTALAIVFVVLTLAINIVGTRPSSTRPDSVITTEAKKRPASSGMPSTAPPGQLPQGIPEAGQ